ncbi:LysE family transporter [Acidaminobacter hydrogenoformans]|uniref:Threonine/homoserine/homoserine lactone efflux protein n=1 Tax=Acidaminobacter hydrogenoformans DSM 2784 TaxID=1120920 RepID=A0A1G5S1I5_9FIRM|nr:LysE family transporter [Acidaminobacter hydrogenoformans]SCZ80008.1 Threonine/homoserine/homoserine lactone efflux protein [Acidaminobacter hydrogenoformans DSM 2784]
MPNVAAFLSYSIITIFTPGPNNIMSMSNASRYGFKKSLPFNVGVFFGFLVILGLSSLFSVTLFALIPNLKPFVTVIGAAYILWLAWKTYHSKPIDAAKDVKHTSTVGTGILLQFVNPKAILFCLTTLSTFIVPYYNSFYVVMLFALFLASLTFVSTCCWSLFGSVFQRVLKNHQKLINTVMALLLVYCAASLFL